MNSLFCWLVTCGPGTSVLVFVEETILPAHAAARRRGHPPTSPVELTYARASPTFGQLNRPSARVADRPSELSRNSSPGTTPVLTLRCIDEDRIAIFPSPRQQGR